MNDDLSALLLTGTTGSGKTAVGAEIGDLLAPWTPHAIVDLDQLGWTFIPGVPAETILRLRIDNLAAIWPNLRSAGLRRVVIAGAITTPHDLALVRDAIRPTRLTVVRLVTPRHLLEARLRQRDSGRRLDAHVEIMPMLERQLDEAHLQDFRVLNDARRPRDVAMAVLAAIGWTHAAGPTNT